MERDDDRDELPAERWTPDEAEMLRRVYGIEVDEETIDVCKNCRRYGRMIMTKGGE